ncbi:hypothetical protein H0A70_05330 [Alcaligenaceae bacterium]|nr:hypothetical protein [Alcaligenaceae bacterium]
MMTQTAKQIAAGQRRSLRAMRKKILDMAAAWDEVDQFNMNTLEELADQTEKVACGLVNESSEWEPMP